MKKVVMGPALMGAAGVCSGELTEPRDVSFVARVDGTKQYYMEILPKPFNKSVAHDLVIGLHGHGADRNQFAKDPRPECAAFRLFAEKYKMIAVTPDYRAPTSWMGPVAEADMVQLIKALKAGYKIKRVFLVGASMGGASALTFAALHPDLVDGVTAMNGLANHVEYKNFQDAINASFGQAGQDVARGKEKRSAELQVEKLTMPVALTTGGQDASVPEASVIRMAEKMKQMNRKVKLIRRPDGGHSTSQEDALEAMKYMILESGKTGGTR